MVLGIVVKRCQVPFGGDVYLLVTYAVGGSGLCVVMNSSWKLVANEVYAKFW